MIELKSGRGFEKGLFLTLVFCLFFLERRFNVRDGRVATETVADPVHPQRQADTSGASARSMTTGSSSPRDTSMETAAEPFQDQDPLSHTTGTATAPVELTSDSDGEELNNSGGEM